MSAAPLLKRGTVLRYRFHHPVGPVYRVIFSTPDDFDMEAIEGFGYIFPGMIFEQMERQDLCLYEIITNEKAGSVSHP